MAADTRYCDSADTIFLLRTTQMRGKVEQITSGQVARLGLANAYTTLITEAASRTLFEALAPRLRTTQRLVRLHADIKGCPG